MDGKYLNIAATYLDKLDVYPYFNICHYLLVSLYARQVTPGNKVFSRQHPLSSWFATMLMCFAGSFLSNFLIGEPLIVPLKSHNSILQATICWYLINYFPFDIAYKICSFLPIYLSLSLAKELYRARMVHIGVTVASKRYSDSMLLWLLIGVVKGCGEDILVPIAHASMGILDTRNNALLRPTFNIKGSLACAIIFSMEKMQKMPLVSSQMFMASLLFLAYFRVSSILVGIKDPFVPFENLICGLFFGGLVDSIRAMSQKQEATLLSSSTDNNLQHDDVASETGAGQGDVVESTEKCNCNLGGVLNSKGEGEVRVRGANKGAQDDKVSDSYQEE